MYLTGNHSPQQRMKTPTHHSSVPKRLLKQYLQARCRLGAHNWIRTTEEFDDIILVEKTCYTCQSQRIEQVYYR